MIFKDDSVRCPFQGCEYVPHIVGTLLTRPKHASGYCLVIGFECETGHRWTVYFEDHSGGIWITVKDAMDCFPPSI